MYRRYLGAALLMVPWDSIGASGGFVSIFPPDSLGHLPRAPARPGFLCASSGTPSVVRGTLCTRAALPSIRARQLSWRRIMKKLSMLGIIVGAALLSAAPFSLQWSQKNVALSLDSADARVGRPLTATSVAGVHRRAHRRAYRHGHYYYY